MVNKKEENPKKEEEKEKILFDWTVPFQALERPRMFKAGLKEYISSKNIEIKSEKEFNKIVEDYTNLKIGG